MSFLFSKCVSLSSINYFLNLDDEDDEDDDYEKKIDCSFIYKYFINSINNS